VKNPCVFQDWRSFSATCDEYVKVFDGEIVQMYGFLSGRIDGMSSTEREARFYELNMANEEDEREYERETRRFVQ